MNNPGWDPGNEVKTLKKISPISFGPQSKEPDARLQHEFLHMLRFRDQKSARFRVKVARMWCVF